MSERQSKCSTCDSNVNNEISNDVTTSLLNEIKAREISTLLLFLANSRMITSLASFNVIVSTVVLLVVAVAAVVVDVVVDGLILAPNCTPF